MSTRTAVFQEQKDGGYKGIYVHFDGYIEGVGRMLHEHYRNPEKTAQLIEKEQALSALRAEVEAHHFDDETPKEYFKADTLEQIRKFEYPNYTDNGEKSGSVNDKGKFIQFIGSDNNGYLYVQTKDGEWLASLSVGYKRTEHEMSDFESLTDYFNEADNA